MKEKLYYSIGEIAEELNIPTHNIRYWEKEIPSIAPKNRVSGKRAYKIDDFEKIKEVHNLLYNNKLTIEGVKQYLHSKDDANLFTSNSNNSDKISEIKNDILQLLSFIKDSDF